MARTHVTAPSLCAAFQATVAKYPDRVALRIPGDTVRITWRTYGERVREIAAGLAGLGVRAGDTVALMLTNRPEFHLVDTATLHTGATPLSIYNTFAPEQVRHVLEDAGATVVVCEEQFVAKLRTAITGTEVKHLVCVDATAEGTVALDDLAADPDFDFDRSWRAVGVDDVLTIIYTSGTTGPPKGVELTHDNMLAEVEATLELHRIDGSDSVVSYLPDAHVANRWGTHYLSLCTGMAVTTCADLKQIIPALTDTRPTLFGAVPQIWYRLKTALETGLSAEPSALKRGLASWAIETGRRRARQVSEGKPLPLPLRVQAELADRLVLSKVRARLGMERIRLAVSGAAPIATEALEFVLALGIPVSEGWGMSETAGIAIVSPPGRIRIGTVGTAVKDTEVRLAEDGELLVRAPMVMRGYRNNPDKTAETIDAEGWLHTGDIATIDEDGYVRIVDRKKELIINAAGKNMSPANIENTIKVSCSLIGFITAIGDNRPFVTALITLEPDVAAAYAAEHGLSDTSPAALAADPGIHAAVESGIKIANEHLARVEQIRKFTILPAFWEPGSVEVTPSVKLRRRNISERYADQIDDLYTTKQ
jgi:long-subunit acyl-CoA synthetase (AMP-forming)